jgi:putative PIG3 family NAD(P)H quinone oxidoreductase
VRALHIAKGGELIVSEEPTPQPRAGEALIRIRAAGLNRADISQRRGKYPAPPGFPQDIPGLEFAGVVEDAGSARLRAGTRVCGLTGGGAQAEFIASPEDLLLELPAALSDVEAAAVPEAYITAHDALVTQAGLHKKERLLVHAVASGVGIAAIQIAKVLGCTTFGTSRTPEKLKRMENVGLDFGCEPTRFDEAILGMTAGAGVDVILDPVGGAYFERNLDALGQLGRLVLLSTLAIPTLMRKRLRIMGTMLRNRSGAEKAQALGAFKRDLWPLFAKGTLKPIVDATYPLERAADAYQAMESNRTVGKIVLTL